MIKFNTFKVICIEYTNSYSLPIIVKKSKLYYAALNKYYDSHYEIYNENKEYMGLFLKKCFLTIAEWREQQNNKIIE